MIRCKLISPTNLMLEHPLYLAPHDEAEFFVVGRKEYTRLNERRFLAGIFFGSVATVVIAAIVTAIAAALR